MTAVVGHRPTGLGLMMYGPGTGNWLRQPAVRVSTTRVATNEEGTKFQADKHVPVLELGVGFSA